LVIDPNQDVVWAHLAEAYTGVGSTAQAENALAKAVQLKPQSGAYRNNYAIALAKSGKMEEAWIQLEEAARLEPANAGHYFYNLGAILINSDTPPRPDGLFRRSNRGEPGLRRVPLPIRACGCWAGPRSLPTEESAGPRARREAFENYLRLAPNGPHAEQARQMVSTIEPR